MKSVEQTNQTMATLSECTAIARTRGYSENFKIVGNGEIYKYTKAAYQLLESTQLLEV